MNDDPRAGRKHSRVYHEAIEDDRFRDVWPDDAALALWLRLLVAADGAWPAAASLPRSTRKAALAKLVDAGLVDLANGDYFRIHGLDAERLWRAGRGKAGAKARWDGDAS